MIEYNRFDWYWIINGSTIYSSKTNSVVQADNASYVAWLSAGGVPTKIASSAELHEVLRVAGVPPYAAVSPLQARRALRAAGIYDQVVAAIEQLADADLSDAWEYATEWRRSDPWIATLGAGLGLTDGQIDGLFIAAHGL
jgi:hypothetical protein